jgi:DnaJ-class molecular chaperone
MNKKADYYSILGVDKKASLDDVKGAYKKLALVDPPYIQEMASRQEPR